ncbi:Nuclear transport factor 2, eukaryote,NTF2-like domain,Nuclear transport factor 2,RNA recognition motif [Cinara cedri]|uniref:Nuclear transport factor 2, eukaryote,NTF2-like domain,Nuclear transport factor 2,RNA recognition motif n=1 Tax=Cinara cedri TaxID=506608 RepID=A0A5E4MVQ3_9HEMI|nr:Nuclear transport factor 2, eukaryote,NTF2-like domain,Nuclear transport factor 2,RNA recognition motif [Cinara cedri]
MVTDSCPNPQSVGREFVRQYYTMLNQSPHYLHRFYSSDSYFVHGGLEPYSRDMTPSIGQKEIHKRVQELNFRDCHAKILQVDSQNTLGNGVVVHVTGELSNCGQPMRRFAQTFVLAAQSPKKYYVHNDIFRYQDVMLNEDDVNEEVDSGQSDGEENGEVEQAPPVLPQPQHQVNYYNPQTQGPTLNGVTTMNVISTSVPLQQLPPEQIPVQVQQHIPTVTAPIQNLAPTVLPPNNNLIRNQQTYNQHSQVLTEQPKIQHQEEPSTINHHVDAKENQELIKKENIPITEAISPGDQPKPLYAQLFKSGKRSTESHIEAPQLVSVPTQNYSAPSLPKATSPDQNNDYPSNSFANNQYEQRNNANRNMRNNYNSRGGMGGRNNMNDRPNRNSFNNRDNGYNSGPVNDTRMNRGGNQPGSYNGMFQSDDQQLFIGKIPPEVHENDLRTLFGKYGNLLDVRIMKGGSKTGDPSMNGNFGFVIFENVETAHKVLKSRPILFPDENGIKLNVEEKKQKSRSSMMNSEPNNGMGRGTTRGGGNSRGGFTRNQNDVQRLNYRSQN